MIQRFGDVVPGNTRGKSEEEQRKPAAIAKENRTHVGGESQLCFAYYLWLGRNR